MRPRLIRAGQGACPVDPACQYMDPVDPAGHRVEVLAQGPRLTRALLGAHPVNPVCQCMCPHRRCAFNTQVHVPTPIDSPAP